MYIIGNVHEYKCTCFIIHFLALVFVFQKNLLEFLSNFVQRQYDHSVIVTVNLTECIDNSTATFELNRTGPTTNHTLYQLLNDIHINGLHIGIGVIKFVSRIAQYQLLQVVLMMMLVAVMMMMTKC